MAKSFEICVCACCAGPTRKKSISEDISDTVSEAVNSGVAYAVAAASKPVYTPAQVVYQLTTQWVGEEGAVKSWASANISYAIPTAYVPDGGSGETRGQVQMTPYMRAMAGQAFEMWDDLIAINLNPVVGPEANITFAYSSTTQDDGTYARTYTSAGGARQTIVESDIWLSSRWSDHSSDSAITWGSKGFVDYVHEIGHALGLSHPGTYNGGDPSYAGSAEFAQDTVQHTIMSYFGGFTPGQGWSTGVFSGTYLPSTPMLYDILAMQMKYGADMTTRAGHTTYGFGANAGRSVFDFNVNRNPIMAIWDGGGIDTLNASGFGQNQVIDLRAGGTSSIGALTGNVAIAFNCMIENAMGGSGADRIVGNAANNTIYGNGGNDTITTDAGNDVIVGGAGNDYIDGQVGYDTAAWGAARNQLDLRTYLESDNKLYTVVNHAGGSRAEGSDSLAGVEALQCAGVIVRLAGAQQNDVSNITGSRFDDAIFQNEATGQIQALKMTDGAATSWTAVTGNLGSAWKAIASGNVKGATTGGAEVFMQNATTGAIQYVSLDGGTASYGTVAASLPGWQLKAVGDVNGDAAVDVIVQATGGAIAYGNMKGGAFQGWVSVAGVSADWEVVGAGDFKGDGFADVVIQSKSSGVAYYGDMAAGQFKGWGVIASNLGAAYKLKTVVDVDGDSFADAVFQNQTTGVSYYADMNNGTLARYGVVAALDKNWVVQGSGDFDNDGFGDVLFQHATAGTTYYADMNANGFDHWTAVTGNIGAQWDVM